MLKDRNRCAGARQSRKLFSLVERQLPRFGGAKNSQTEPEAGMTGPEKSTDIPGFRRPSGNDAQPKQHFLFVLNANHGLDFK